MTAGDAVRAGARWLAGFITENAPQSSARLIAIACALTACVCGLGTIAFAFRHPDQAGTTAALGGTTITALGGLVAAALAVRKRNADGDSP